MGNIRDISDLISKSTSGSNGDPELIFFNKIPRISPGAAAPNPISGRNVSLWQYWGSPEQGATPTSPGQVLYSSSIGAIKFASAIPGFERNITQVQAINHTTNYGTLILYDRLFHMGGLGAVTTAEQTVQGNPPSPAITRNVSGEGNFMFMEVYTAIGSTPSNLSAEYINQNGQVASSVLNGIATTIIQPTQVMFLPFSGRDSGVRAVTKVRLSNSTATVGNFGITIGKPIAYIPLSLAGISFWRDFTTGLPTVPKLDNDACLALLFVSCFTSTPPEISGFIHTVQA